MATPFAWRRKVLVSAARICQDFNRLCHTWLVTQQKHLCPSWTLISLLFAPISVLCNQLSHKNILHTQSHTSFQPYFSRWLLRLLFVANYSRSRNSCYTPQLVHAAVTRPFLLQAKAVAMPQSARLVSDWIILVSQITLVARVLHCECIHYHSVIFQRLVSMWMRG